MSDMKKGLLLFGAMLALVLLVTACGETPSTSGNESSNIMNGDATEDTHDTAADSSVNTTQAGDDATTTPSKTSTSKKATTTEPQILTVSIPEDWADLTPEDEVSTTTTKKESGSTTTTVDTATTTKAGGATTTTAKATTTTKKEWFSFIY